MRSHHIWNDVDACIYKSSKNWGARDTCHLDQYVGSSSSNSHLHVKFTTTKRYYSEYKGFIDVWVFRTSIDNIVLKESIMSNDAGRPCEFLKQNSRLGNLPKEFK